MKTKANLIAAILMIGLATLHAQVVTIDSLDANGRLTATVPPNAVFSVEWAGSLTSSNGWQKGWSQLRDVKSADGSVDVEVPMFFRLSCWTNGLFLNAPVGRTFHYAVSNAIGETWHEEIEVMGDIYVPALSNSYRMIRSEEFYESADEIPLGAQQRRTLFLRADENSSAHLDLDLKEEVYDWKIGTNGTKWAFFSSSAYTTIDSEIMDHEDILIGTTNYSECVKIFSKGQYDGSQWWLDEYPVLEYTEWIKPGGYLVKRENWWVHSDVIASNAAPVVYELQGWTDL